MAFFAAGAYNPPPKEPSDRSQDLENLVGNYFITEHQLTKIRSRIIDHIKTNPRKSTFMFRSDDEKRWFKVNLEVEEVSNEPEPEPVAMIDGDDGDVLP